MNCEVIKAANLILNHLGCCSGQKWQSFWGFAQDSTWLVYNACYDPTRSMLRENYNIPLWTLPLQSLISSDSSDRFSVDVPDAF